MVNIQNLLEFAQAELEQVGMGRTATGANLAMRNHILKVLSILAYEQLTGFNSAAALHIVAKLFNYEPLLPLTGDPSEWADVSNTGGGMQQQNLRCRRVFIDATGQPVDTTGKVFRLPDGMWVSTSASSVPIDKFPYSPTTQFVE